MFGAATTYLNDYQASACDTISNRVDYGIDNGVDVTHFSLPGALLRDGENSTSSDITFAKPTITGHERIHAASSAIGTLSCRPQEGKHFGAASDEFNGPAATCRGPDGRGSDIDARSVHWFTGSQQICRIFLPTSADCRPADVFLGEFTQICHVPSGIGLATKDRKAASAYWRSPSRGTHIARTRPRRITPFSKNSWNSV